MCVCVLVFCVCVKLCPYTQSSWLNKAVSSEIIHLNYHNYQIENDWYGSFYVSTLDGTKEGLSFFEFGE